MIKKLLLLMLLCVTTVVGAWGQIGTYGTEPNTATISASGSTLTISGKGDLTTINQDVVTYKFKANAVGAVYTSTDGGSTATSVAENDIFSNSANAYYKEILGEKTRVDIDAESQDVAIYTLDTYVTGSTVRIAGNYISEKLTSVPLYKSGGTNNTWNDTESGRNGYWLNSATPVGDTWPVESWEEGKFLVDDVNGTYRVYVNSSMTDDKFYRALTESEYNEYVNSTTYFKLNQPLYTSTNGIDFTRQEANIEIAYNPAVHFYSVGASTFEPYDAHLGSEESVFALFNSNDYLSSESTPMSFVEILTNAVLGGTYTDVVFASEGAGTLTINPAIVQAILFPNNAQNGKIKNLDLGAATITTFERAFEQATGDYTYNLSVEEITLPLIAGNIVPSNVIPSAYNDAHGSLKTIKIPEGYTAIAENAFRERSQITLVTMPDGITEIGNHAFYLCTALKKVNPTATHNVSFPHDLVTIGEFAFGSCALEADETKPLEFLGSESGGSIKNIMAGAFSSILSVKYIIFREGVEFIGNSAFSLPSEIANAEDYVQRTITFPNTVKYIGPGAFEFRMFEDVYFKSTTAPLCPMGYPLVTGSTPVNAFYEVIHMGNNGFQSGPSTAIPLADKAETEGYANRENYRDSGYRYFTILHYPDNLTPAQEETYKDITRVYETYGQGTSAWSWANAVKDTKGLEEEDLYGYNNTKIYKEPNVGYLDTYDHVTVWPSQSQWMRAYGTVYNGVNWNGISEYRPELTDEMIALMIKDNLKIQVKGITGAVTITDNTTVTETQANEYNATLDGAVKAGDPKTYYTTQDEVNNANAELSGAVQEGTFNYTQEQANAYNAKLEGAVSTEDIRVPAVEAKDAVYYSDDEKENINNTVYVKETLVWHDAVPATYWGEDEIWYNSGNNGVYKIEDKVELDGYYTAEYLSTMMDSWEYTNNDTQLDEDGTTTLYYYKGTKVKAGAQALGWGTNPIEKTPAVAAYWEVTADSKVVPADNIKEPAVEAHDAIYYTQELANYHNAELSGAKTTTDTYTMTAEEATAYNNALPDAVKIGDVKTTYTAEEAIEHNSNLTNAVAAGSTLANYNLYMDQLSMDAYQGTRRFVIGSGDTKPEPYYTIDVKGGNWWTICVPFNMTKAMIDEVFGEGTNVCLFSGVERVNTATKKQITLKFQNDVYLHKTIKETYMDGGKLVTRYQENFNKEGTAVSDPDDIVIYAHESYMIYPKKINGDAAPYVVPKYRPVTGNPIPTILTSTGESTDGPKEYRFVGNYNDSKIPEFSYFYAKKNGDTKYKFWFAQNGKIAWKPNKSVVQSQDRQGGTLDNNEFFGGQPETDRAKQISLFGWDSFFEEENIATEVTIVAGDGDNSTTVYNLNGQAINPNMQIPGHVYIKNGKKFISK